MLTALLSNSLLKLTALLSIRDVSLTGVFQLCPCWLYTLIGLQQELSTPQAVLSNWKRVDLKAIDFSNLTRANISILILTPG